MSQNIPFYEKAKFYPCENFKPAQKRCILLISVGQKYHEGEKFLATVKLLNQHNFGSCDIMVADTLQRHNYATNMSPQDSNNLTQSEGDKWIIRNLKAINSLTMPFYIRRWDEYLAHERNAYFKQITDEAYENNADYRNAINATVGKFMERYTARNPDLDYEVLFKGCLTYLLEECPIIMPLWAEMGYDYVVYPKKMTEAMSKTYELFVKEQFPEKGNWLALKFEKKFLNNAQPLNLKAA